MKLNSRKLSWAWWFIPKIPAVWEVEIERQQFKASPSNKGSKTLSQKTNQVW
jgi:hypothetical protein